MKPDRHKANPTRPDFKAEIGQLKRERILTVAAELFAAHGFHNVSVESIADALGVTKPFVYYNFRDKNDLLLAICRRGAELTFSCIEAVAHRRGSSIERLTEFCHAFANIVIDNRTFIAIYVREDISLSREGRHEIAQLRAEVDRHITKLIDEAVAAGEADSIDPPTTAAAIGVMISALWFCYRERGPTERARMVSTFVQLCLRMVGARSAVDGDGALNLSEI